MYGYVELHIYENMHARADYSYRPGSDRKFGVIFRGTIP